MEPPGDKMATTQEKSSSTVPRKPAAKLGKNGKPAAVARFGWASVPVYRCGSGGGIRQGVSPSEQVVALALRQCLPELIGSCRKTNPLAKFISENLDIDRAEGWRLGPREKQLPTLEFISAANNLLDTAGRGGTYTPKDAAL